jgi:hypothetical protein
MGAFLQNYGAGEERRNKIIKWSIGIAVGVVLLAWFSYLSLHNFFETRTVKNFLAEVNSRNYQAAYRDWGCTEATPCPNYDYKRFLEDWGPDKKIASPWKIDSVEGCTSFVTVNVQAQGSELESLGVLRGSKTVMFAPSPECQEKTWKWKQFFHRLFGGSQS